LRATRRLHEQHRPRKNRPNARAGLWGHLRLKPAGKARYSGPRSAGMTSQVARKRAPTSAAPAACRSPLAGDASARRAASTTGKSSKCPGWFVGIPQGQTSGKAAALGSALCWHDFPGRPQAGKSSKCPGWFVGIHQGQTRMLLRAFCVVLGSDLRSSTMIGRLMPKLSPGRAGRVAALLGPSVMLACCKPAIAMLCHAEPKDFASCFSHRQRNSRELVRRQPTQTSRKIAAAADRRMASSCAMP
jgi:hypothetical protein